MPFTCAICFDQHLDDQLYARDACVDHPFCKNCMITYASGLIREGLVNLLRCPAYKCTYRLKRSDLEGFLNVTDLTAYDNAVLLFAHPNGRACTKCGHVAVYSASKKQPIIKCIREGCGTVFCFFHSDAHPESNCNEFEARNAQNDSACQVWERENATCCEHCKAYVQKTSGCNHMRCRCGFEFCYLCGKRYSRNHYRWWNITGCTKSKETPDSAMEVLKKVGQLAGVVIGTPIAIATVVALAVPAAALAGAVVLMHKVNYLMHARRARDYERAQFEAAIKMSLEEMQHDQFRAGLLPKPELTKRTASCCSFICLRPKHKGQPLPAPSPSSSRGPDLDSDSDSALTLPDLPEAHDDDDGVDVALPAVRLEVGLGASAEDVVDVTPREREGLTGAEVASRSRDVSVA